jgi:hypothetical protein
MIVLPPDHRGRYCGSVSVDRADPTVDWWTGAPVTLILMP